MALLTITAGSADVFVSDLYLQINANTSVTVSRPLTTIPEMKSIGALAAAGSITYSVLPEASDRTMNKVVSGVSVKAPGTAVTQATGAVAPTYAVNHDAGVVQVGGAVLDLAAGTTVTALKSISVAGAVGATGTVLTAGAATVARNSVVVVVCYKNTAGAAVVLNVTGPACVDAALVTPTDANIAAAVASANGAAAAQWTYLAKYQVQRTADTTLAAVVIDNTIRANA